MGSLGDRERVNEQSSDFKLAERVASYPSVANLIDLSKGYYQAAKDASPIVAFASGNLETGINHYVVPTVNNLLDSSTYQVYARPILVRADGMANVALDSAETNAQKLKDGLEKNKEALYQRSNDLIEITQKKIVDPVDGFLKESIVGLPINKALDLTERVAVGVLEVKVDHDGNVGPIYRSAALSKQVSDQTLQKLHNLSLRAPEKINAMQYTVDLIEFAKKSLDELNIKIHQKVEDGTVLVKELPQKAKDQWNTRLSDAITAIHTANQIISSKIPPEVLEKVQELRKAAIIRLEGAEDATLYEAVVNKSSTVLNETANSILQYKDDHQVLAVAYDKLTNVLHSLVSVLDKSKTKSN
eukprot:TRINITY_DN8511_c0_g1_i1.p1 TRINITY_DN8511_c0_g1~~TRINITY_DN8511_c0_g1_i1.p1  ORF type:complete len:358 (+),score=125.31 TRINITY_DN8511_c0_g1_i1:90-1163(+)